jgi:hypothetical protein
VVLLPTRFSGGPAMRLALQRLDSVRVGDPAAEAAASGEVGDRTGEIKTTEPALAQQKAGCFRRRTERGTTRCGKCNRVHAQAQKMRLRRNYERDVAAGVCVRCHKRPATATNKRCQKCQDRHAEQKRLSR